MLQFVNRTEATPHLPRGRRARCVLRRRWSDCHHPRLPGTTAYSNRSLVEPGATSNIDVQGSVCVAAPPCMCLRAWPVEAAGAPRLRGFRPAVVVQLAPTGGVEPRPFGLPM